MYELPPILSGSEAQQIAALRAYLVRIARMNGGGEGETLPAAQSGAMQQSGTSRSKGSGETATMEDIERLRASAARQRDLILKTTAETILENVEMIREILRSDYVAASDFGTYRESARLEMEATAKAVVEQFDMLTSVEAGNTYTGGVRQAVEQLHGEIRRGFLTDPETGEYIFGIAVAEKLNFGAATQEKGGLQYYELAGNQTFGLYTAKGWQFWIDGQKVGWFASNDSSLHAARLITESSLQLGDGWEMTATGGLGIRYIGG